MGLYLECRIGSLSSRCNFLPLYLERFLLLPARLPSASVYTLSRRLLIRTVRSRNTMGLSRADDRFSSLFNFPLILSALQTRVLVYITLLSKTTTRVSLYNNFLICVT
jgi:hypothetical protein